MNQLLNSLKRLLILPFSWVSTRKAHLEAIKQSSKGRSMMSGLPAVVIAILGVGALGWTSYVQNSTLEEGYKKRVETIQKRTRELSKELQNEINIKRAAQQTNVSFSNKDERIIAEDDERLLELEMLKVKELTFWKKLLKLNPDELDYRYQLANVFRQQGKNEQCLALMKQSAPLEEPGYSKAHFWLAQYYLSQRPLTRANRAQALNHIDHCLTRDNGHQNAKFIKGQLLQAQGRVEPAYQVFRELFEEGNPELFLPLTQLNETLERPKANVKILNDAITEFQINLTQKDLPVDKWLKNWRGIASCLKLQKNYSEAEKLLKREIAKLDKPDDQASRRFVEQLLAGVYLDWMANLPQENTEETFREGLELIKKSFELDKNDVTLAQLTRFTLCEFPDIAAEAREIYDPLNEPGAPSAVFNVLGGDAMSKKNYPDAIRYFENAYKKNKQNANVLNNLAYTYLVSERGQDANRALKLVDEAIRMTPKTEENRQILSHFYDTRGTALLRLNRTIEALAAFEVAHIQRPDNPDILESLIKCYQDVNLSADVYKERLKQLTEQGAGDSDNG